MERKSCGVRDTLINEENRLLQTGKGPGPACKGAASPPLPGRTQSHWGPLFFPLAPAGWGQEDRVLQHHLWLRPGWAAAWEQRPGAPRARAQAGQRGPAGTRSGLLTTPLTTAPAPGHAPNTLLAPSLTMPHSGPWLRRVPQIPVTPSRATPLAQGLAPGDSLLSSSTLRPDHAPVDFTGATPPRLTPSGVPLPSWLWAVKPNQIPSLQSEGRSPPAVGSVPDLGLCPRAGTGWWSPGLVVTGFHLNPLTAHQKLLRCSIRDALYSPRKLPRHTRLGIIFPLR